MFDYFTVFMSVFAINIIPILMPPTWLVLGFFYANSPFDIFTLALVGALSSTAGRFLLTYVGTFSRHFANQKRLKSMDSLGKSVKKHPIKSFIITFAYALSPFPSNVYFATLGIAKSRSIPVFAAFFLGRLLSYYILISTASVIFNTLGEVFDSRFLQIVVIDIAAIVFMLIFIMIDWDTLLKKKKLKFIPIRFRK